MKASVYHNHASIGYYNTAGSAYSVAVADGYAYVADFGVGGLRIIEFYGAGVEETPSAEVRAASAGAAIVRGVVRLVPAASLEPQASSLLDISGRKVMELQPGPNDVRRLVPGVYFVREQLPSASRGSTAASIDKVIVTR